MVRYALIGYGKVASVHAQSLAEAKQSKLVAVWGRSAEKAALFAKEWDILPFTDMQKMIVEAKVDAVIITTPHPVHKENTVEALKAGAHVLVEKPMALTVAECQEMIDCTARAGVMLFTGFDYRFSPAALQIRQWLRDGAIGDLRSLRLIYIWNCHGKRQRNDQGLLVENARRQGRMDEGGPMVDCGVHQIDLARFWTGSEVQSWTAAGAWVDEYDAPDHMYLHMQHDSGAHSMVEISYSYCHTCQQPVNVFTYDLIGTKGLIRYDRNAKILDMRNQDGVFTMPFAPEKNFAALYEHFRDALAQGGSDVLPTGLDGLMAAKISREATDALVAQCPRGSK